MAASLCLLLLIASPFLRPKSNFISDGFRVFTSFLLLRTCILLRTCVASRRQHPVNLRTLTPAKTDSHAPAKLRKQIDSPQSSVSGGLARNVLVLRGR